MKSMQFAVKDTRELLNLPQLSQVKQNAPLDDCNIQLKDVSFSYGGSDGKEVLRHLNLTIPQGKFTALVGPSGGGKSTIARLAARFWDVTGGSITLGGRDIRELPLKQLSREISFVTQDNFLFDCSLKENIRLGRPGASDEEVFAAARAAQCEEFIGRLEHGWDTTAGDAGKQLSGGERQRIAIARAILKDAPIVILDEATAFTDPENENKIQRSIMALSKGKTLLVIAHRLSTIQNADQIVVLEKGQIVDRGTQGELLSRCPLYQALWAAHIGAQTWAVTSGEKEGTEMFHSVGRILRWAKGYRKRMILGFVCSFFATWCTAGPVMLAAWALGRLIGNAWGETNYRHLFPGCAWAGSWC